MVVLLLLLLLWRGSLQQQGEYKLNVQTLMTVREGLCVHVPCSFSYLWRQWYASGELYTYWYLSGDSRDNDDLVATNNPNKPVKRESWNRFFLADPRNNDCSLTIRDARISDSGIYFFRVERNNVKYSYKVKMLNLQVTDAPWNITIVVSYRNVTALKLLENNSSFPVLEGEALRLLCVADSNPPAQLIWFHSGQSLSLSQPSDPGVLELTWIQMEHEGEFICQAQNLLGSLNFSLSLSVHYRPQLLGPSCSWEDEALHCNCSSQAQPTPSLRWRLGEGLLEGNFSNASCTVTFHSAGSWANSSLSLNEGLSAGLRLSCEARNAHGEQTAMVLLLPGKSGSLAAVVPATLGGAGVMALLSLCLCLIIFCVVKAYRKRAAKIPNVMTDEDLVMDRVTWNFQEKPSPDRCTDPASPAKVFPPSGQPQEGYYANLMFHKMKPWEPQDYEATNSTVEYSEIKLSK